MDWLALHLPALALEVYTRALSPGVDQPEQPSQHALNPQTQPPLAVSERERIIARNAAAAALGITPGLPEGAARALVAELRILPRKVAAEQAALRRLAAWAMAFSDQVSLEPPAALVLEAGRSLKLFGGGAALRERVLGGVLNLGWRARCVLAPTPSAALVLAAAGLGSDEGRVADIAVVPDRDALRRLLTPLPLTALGFPARDLDDLHRMGLMRVGDLLRLPRAGLAERLGPERLVQLERLLGERADPRRPFVPPQRFHGSLDLPAEVPDAPALLFACRRLIDELGGFLLARQAGVQRLDWRLGHADGAPTRFELGSAAPARDPRRWLELLRERLNRLELPAPVRDIRLDSEQLRPLAPDQVDLFPLDAAAKAPDPALLDRLRARLGREAVRGIEAVADHRPEHAWRTREPLLTSPGPGRRSSSKAAPEEGWARRGLRADRPLWLLRTPQPLGLNGNRPWLDGPLTLGAGCERIDTGWWDGQPVARDYYVAVTTDGECLWIYRDLRGAGGWFVHGIFGSRSRGPG